MNHRLGPPTGTYRYVFALYASTTRDIHFFRVFQVGAPALTPANASMAEKINVRPTLGIIRLTADTKRHATYCSVACQSQDTRQAPEY